jgi:hypothetical protein
MRTFVEVGGAVNISVDFFPNHRGRRAVRKGRIQYGTTKLETTMRRLLPAAITFASAIVLLAAPAHAQTDRATRFLENCQNNNSRNNSEQFCEVRNLTLAAGRSLAVDGRDNGGITVHGWDGMETKVTVMVQAQAASEAEAAVIARAVTITGSGGQLRADGPDTRGRRESWSVSYEIWTPRHTDLSLTAKNGGLSVDGVDSKMELETVNGGLSLVDVAGDVHGTTSNGGVTAELSGDRWRGAGLDVRTSNGGVRLYVPANYSAQLETGTVNGGMNIDFPIAAQGSIGRRLSTTLGSGGPLVRVTTTNGGVSVVRR